MSKNLTKGIYLATLTAAISGFSIFFNKFAVGIVKPPLVFTALKNVEVGILIFAVLLASKKLAKVKKLKKKELLYLFFIGIIGGAIPFYLFFTGLASVSAINAALIQKTLVIWVALLAIPFLKEKLSPLQIFAVVLLFAGNLTIGGFKGFKYSQGELFILAATLLWSVEYVLAKKILPKVDPDIVVAARMGFGSILLIAASLFVAPAALGKVVHLNAYQWTIMTISVVTLLAYVMSWYRALRYAPAITVTAILVASTLVTNVLTAAFVTHSLSTDILFQSALMLAGVGIFWFLAKKQVVSPKTGIEVNA